MSSLVVVFALLVVASTAPAPVAAVDRVAGPALHVVTFEVPGVPAIVHRIAATGAALVQPVGTTAYVVHASPAQARELGRVDGVAQVAVMPPAMKVAPSVTVSTRELLVATVAERGGVSGARAAAAIRFTGVPGALVRVDGGLALARRLAGQGDVYAVQAAPPPPFPRGERASRLVLDGHPASAPGYAGDLAAIGTDGSGVLVGHLDWGADLSHADIAGRIAGCLDYVAGGALCADGSGADLFGGHGTATLSRLVGTGASGATDTDGFAYGLGVAPGAQAVASNAPAGDGFERGTHVPFQDVRRAGAVIASNSYGLGNAESGYDLVARALDASVRDADPDAPGDQPLTIVFAYTNNDGSPTVSVDEAKNVVLVGASGHRGRNGPGTGDLSRMSAHGPASDGRIAPTLVAPGHQVMSARPVNGTHCLPLVGSYPAHASLEDPPSARHGACTGTSYAAPHAAGAAMLFVARHRQLLGVDPSPAMVRAALVHGAADLVGGGDGRGGTLGAAPDSAQGWGRVVAGATLATLEHDAVVVDGEHVLTDSGDMVQIVVEPSDPDRPVQVTLAWTDAPGAGLGGTTPAWVNDLDLHVESDPPAGGGRDERNNLERRRVPPGAGRIVVRVAAASLTGDGVPSRAGATDQDFALIVSNARRVAAPEEEAAP